MKRVFAKTLVLMVSLCLSAFVAMAQGTITGKIVDANTGDPLIGATVMVEGTTQGCVADVNGEFSLQVSKKGNVILLFRFVGYESLTKTVNLNKNQKLGEIRMTESSVGLDEVMVSASYVTADRSTPIAYSSIEPEALETKLGNKEFPSVLKSTPSIYTTDNGGGYGDSRVTLRGFDTDNIGVLINGVPINGMENGKVYWSNWAGLSDVTKYMQVQRGLGASKLGLSSVGGTINIITQTTDAQMGGSVYYGIGNDGYEKMAFSVSTGLLKNGWAISLSGSRTEGDGYFKGGEFLGWNYFVNVSKKINDAHRLSFTAFGAPQKHNQRGNKALIEDYRKHRDGIRMNTSYGYINGQVVPTGYGYNEYHKPQMSLNHFWNINDHSNLSTAVYVSKSTGGGKRVYGDDKNRLQYDYQTGRPYAETSLTPEGLIDYESVMRDNAASVNGSSVVFTMETNAHDWYGLLSTYTNNLSESLCLTAGIDGRYYKGYHYAEITDLLGGEYFIDNNIKYREPNRQLFVGDKVNYHNIGNVMWLGGFVQAEITKALYSAFLSASVSDQSYRRKDEGKYGKYSTNKTLPVTTSWQHFVPVSVKAGFNYKIGGFQNVFVNAGYVTKAPLMNNVFINNSNEVQKDAKYEKIVTAEIGYGLSLEKFNLNFNGYYTKWMDKSVTKSIGNEKATIPNIDAIHMGIELEASYKPCSTLDFKAMFSLGDWKWGDDVMFDLYNDQQELIGSFNAYIKDLHVGNAAQTTASLMGTWEPLPKFRIGVDWNYFGRNYADFDPTLRNSASDRSDAWKMPEYSTLDANVSYKFKIGKLGAKFYCNVNNILDKEYIADAKDGSDHSAKSALVYFGNGITWSTGLKITF
ncbi:MAG: TonB-dependent receptor [Odoribacter sp.]|nr:TonB-dependent receptor [Odoribacter sp.]